MNGRVVRGVVVSGILAIAVAALVVLWGDAPAVIGAIRGFPPALLVPVILLTTWNYALRWLRWHYYLRVLGVTAVDMPNSILVFLSGFAMGLTPGKSGEVTKRPPPKRLGPAVDERACPHGQIRQRGTDALRQRA